MRPDDLEKLFSAAEKGDKMSIEKIGKDAAATLSDVQKKNIERAMSDPEYLRSVLSSPKAQEIMKKLQGGKK